LPGGKLASTSDGGAEGDQETRTDVTVRLLELTMKAADHFALVEEFMALLYERFAEGSLCRDRTLKML